MTALICLSALRDTIAKVPTLRHQTLSLSVKMKARHFLPALLAVLVMPTTVRSQSSLEPCGTISRSITLQSDCAAPLIVGANNIKINLNGFTVKPGPVAQDQGHVDLVNRRGVTVTNGTVEGFCEYCIQVRGGHSNRITDISLLGGEYSQIGVLLKYTNGNLVKNVRIRGLGGPLGISLYSASRNMITGVTTEGRSPSVSLWNGSHNQITRNHLESGGALSLGGEGNRNVFSNNDIRCVPGITVGVDVYTSASNTIIQSNTITACHWGIRASSGGDGTGILIKGNTVRDSGWAGIVIGGDGSIVRSNQVHNSGHVDMVDAHPDCGTNVWKNNSSLSVRPPPGCP